MSMDSLSSLSFATKLALGIFLVAFVCLWLLGAYGFFLSILLAAIIAIIAWLVLHFGFGETAEHDTSAGSATSSETSMASSAPAAAATSAAPEASDEDANAEAELRRAEMAEQKRKADAEAAERAAADEAKRKAEAAEAAQRAEEEANRKAAADEAEAARKAAQEEAARKAAEDEANRKAAADEAARKAAHEEAARKAAQEEAARQAAVQEASRKAAEDEAERNAAMNRAPEPTPAAFSSTTAHDDGASTTEDYDGDGIREGVNEGTRPAGLDAPRNGQADDLKQIKGIGAKMEALCNRLGFWHFDQIAAWSSEEVAWVDANLQGFKGRVTRDTWVEQARVLASGGATEFSKRVEGGDVY